jgi:trehalose 6-phosphate phosphatase
LLSRFLQKNRAARAHKYIMEIEMMTNETALLLDQFFAGFSREVAPLLLLDYDGTLAPFRVDRSKAHPFRGVREVIAHIQEQTRTRVVVITGRPAREIGPLLRGDPPVELRPVEVWGLHGAERLHADGKHELRLSPPETQRTLDQLREYLRHNNLGGEYEDKPNAAVMHWRGTSARTARFIAQRTRELFTPFAQQEGFTLLEFESGLELRTGPNKGDAVRELVREIAPGTPVAYLGDDITDEAAFGVVNQLDGPHLSALVRPEKRATEADVWLRPPTELRAFLKRWLKAASRQRAKRKAPVMLQALAE